ncbi:uncharacterized serine-rich protein C215.13-like isoform X2 [Homarus americanus]|uniref:Putative CDK-activating kinase assembly factor MAT1-like 2 n=1 Tax=Homarus americanus TaxID=6706 RepID=A0A8J5JQC4_HOMAM|nr:uncharacterized serine-rich protein C215.13-like isoform X2 [Homarus americanus]KAG7162542.1 putative CDK-activating kinase assembly factor MAT1-like 2 [Homarus americanus]
MPADEGPGAGVREVRGGEAHFSTKTSSRASLASVPTPTSCYSSSSSSVSEIVGLGQLRSSDSLSSAESHSPAFRDPVASTTGGTCTSSSSTSVVRIELLPQENIHHVSPASSPTSQTSIYIQHSYVPDHSVSTSSDRNYGCSPIAVLQTSPDCTPTVTISRHGPTTTSVGWLRGSPTPSLASSVSSSVGQSSTSPSLGASSLVVSSVCTSLPSSSLMSSLPLSIPPVSLSPYLSHSHSPNTTRIVRTTSAAPSTQQPSPASLRSSPALRITEASSTLDQLVNSSNRVAGLGEQRGVRVHNLALTHLASSDAVPPCLPSPPPSYDQLCNPNALPTYQEATQSSSSKRRAEQRTVFTLPSNTESTNSDPLLQTYVVQDGERGLRGGVLASLAAELSDSEGGYSTILDAIPHEHPRDPCATVPVRFLHSCSLRRLRPPKVQPPCLTSVCNKALVRKELNRRWPFIAGALEVDHCPGLILVECSSHLTVAHLPEPSRQHDGGIIGGLTSVSGGGDMSGIIGDNFTDVMLGSPSVTTNNGSTTIDLDATALTSQVLFYLCGKCVGYDSFDIDNVKSHIEYDCPGSYNQWGNNAELYLVLRAVLFVVIIIFVFVCLPYLRL